MDINVAAQRIVTVIVAPETLSGFMDGAISVPRDVFTAMYSLMDTDTRYQRGEDRFRLYMAIRNGLLARDKFIDAMQIIIDNFCRYIPEGKQNGLYSHTLGSFAGRQVAASTITRIISNTIFNSSNTTAIYKIVRSIGIQIFLIYGVLERCIYKSRELQETHSQLYYRLRHPNDLDLLYVFIEDYTAPFLDALKVRQNHGEEDFLHIINIVDKELQYRGY
ncbi:hypothetical protein V2I52_22395 [Brenneria sp. g21c3]|uniref:hypothetical protein n=1 Tax=Brenneria sp. g21c3 TaxID=3093893 RepID=UPI002ECD8BFD|nr:hypothetical protein [Brenneria sp. g21c3]